MDVIEIVKGGRLRLRLTCLGRSTVDEVGRGRMLIKEGEIAE